MGLNTTHFHNSKAGKKHEAEMNPLGLPSGGGNYGGKMVPTFLASAPGMGITDKTPTDDQTLQNSGGDISVHDEEQIHSPDVIREVHGHTTKLNLEKQQKHIPESAYYVPGKSVFRGTLQDAQKLVNQFGGTGRFVDPKRTKERVDFGRVIGDFVDMRDGTLRPTTIGIIHYSKNGTHISPRAPKED